MLSGIIFKAGVHILQRIDSPCNVPYKIITSEARGRLLASE